MYGNVVANTFVGGISANLYGYASMENCYNLGEISNSIYSNSKIIYIGGLAPILSLDSDDYKVRNCYNAGKIISNIPNNETVIYAGNLIGSHSSGTIENCYYEKNEIEGIGIHSAEDCIDDVKEVKNTDMKTKEMVEKLNGEATIYYFDEQNINNGYPILKWQYIELAVKQMQPNTSLDVLKSKVETNEKEILVYNNKKEIEDNQLVGTGMQIGLLENENLSLFTITIIGDVNGDGKADFSDILQMNKHRLNKAPLQGEYLKAGDVTEDGGVDFSDILKVNKYRLGKINSL